MRHLTIALLGAALLCLSPVHAADYFPPKGDGWSRRTPQQEKFDPAKLKAAIDYAISAELKYPPELAKAADIIGDIQIVDQCLADGVDVNSALTLLSRSYGRLAETGVPPGVDRSRYTLGVTTLQALTLQAAEGYDDDRTGAVAKYSTARSETRVLFKQLNVALGSNFSLP
jgi:hypothetical protein